MGSLFKTAAGREGMHMYEFHSVMAAQAQIQKLRMQGAHPADSICAYLHGRHRLLSTREVAVNLGRHQETVRSGSQKRTSPQ